jgi:small subunit ribosomal protein S13
MARLVGIEIKDDWKVDYALTNIKGIGWSLSNKLLDELKIDKSKRIKDISSDELSKIAAKLEKIPTEGDVTRQVRGNISRLKAIGSYRGMRHNQGLPARGQRTRRNARAKRGKRRTVGAFRKEAISKMQQQKPKE